MFPDGYTIEEVEFQWRETDPIQNNTAMKLPEFVLTNLVRDNCTVGYITGKRDYCTVTYIIDYSDNCTVSYIKGKRAYCTVTYII